MLWTRLAPEPLRADGGMEPRPVEVRWEVAKDPSMRRLVRRGRTTAWPSFAHSVHIRFFDGDRQGSLKARLERSELEVDWRIADRVGDPDAAVRTLRTFAVESGRPGIAQA